jgi:hypothetical protein
LSVNATSIANLALQALGESSPITDINTANTRSQQCKRVYEPERRALLRSHPWSFARARTTLTPETEAPAFGYTKQYALPAECLRFLGGPSLTYDQFEIEGKNILTDEGDALQIWYTKDIEDPNQFDPLFVNALALIMAMRLAEPVTGSSTKFDQVERQYMDAIRLAKRTSAIELPAREFQQDSWLDARI